MIGMAKFGVTCPNASLYGLTFQGKLLFMAFPVKNFVKLRPFQITRNASYVDSDGKKYNKCVV